MRTRSKVFDALLALALFIPGQLEAWIGPFSTHRQGPHWAEAAAYGIAALALGFRRRYPLPSVFVLCGAMIAEFAVFGAPEGYGVAIPPLIAAYTVANEEDRRRALWGLAAVLVMGAAWIMLDPQQTSVVQHFQAVAWVTPWVAAWLLGAYRRTRRLYVQGLVREREERALSAVAEERNRIARELHDVVGHSISVMTVQASAVRRLMRPDQARERAALETVESTGREALAEMRRMVGVLRSASGDADLAPPPTLEQLDRLIDTFQHAGLDVDVYTDGERTELAPGLELTAYRLVQEALTNTLKHAEATRATIRICYQPDELTISVRDNGHGPDPTAVPGVGLLGMRDRVAVYGGALRAGAVDGGGYELSAQLPLVPT